MDRQEAQLATVEAELAETRKRLLDLERQFASFRQVKILDDLDDTETLYQAPPGGTPGGQMAPADGDVLTFDASRTSPFGGLWVPGAAGSRHVAWTGYIDCVSSSWAPTVEMASVDGGSPAAIAVDTHSTSTVFSVGVAGVWLVSALIESSSAVTQFELRGDSWSTPDDAACFDNYAIRLDGAADFTGQSISAQFWLPKDGIVFVATTAADCRIYVQAALYMETPIDVGTCGG